MVDDLHGRLENNLINSSSDVPEAILYWPARGNIYINDLTGMGVADMNRELAPFEERFDEDPDGIYDPVDGDVPFIFGDEAIWYVMNDAGNVKEFGGVVGGVGAEAIGMEIQAMAFGFATSFLLVWKFSSVDPLLLSCWFGSFLLWWGVMHANRTLHCGSGLGHVLQGSLLSCTCFGRGVHEILKTCYRILGRAHIG